MTPTRWITLGLLVFTLGTGQAQAQTTSVGPYYAPPSWDQTLPSATRFIILTNFQSQAVLDRETGLVWEKEPTTTVGTGQIWGSAHVTCTRKTVGGRKGWRLPSVQELLSLIDPTRRDPALPLSHPFTNVLSAWYWSSMTSAEVPAAAWFVDVTFGDTATTPKDLFLQVWCVRGGMNADVY